MMALRSSNSSSPSHRRWIQQFRLIHIRSRANRQCRNETKVG
uniref:Uncharacterized protein n=1 Tax=Anguilla anguilla TaxID=7936 RepID=A0A0E9QYL2_ANGAN